MRVVVQTIDGDVETLLVHKVIIDTGDDNAFSIMPNLKYADGKSAITVRGRWPITLRPKGSNNSVDIRQDKRDWD